MTGRGNGGNRFVRPAILSTKAGLVSATKALQQRDPDSRAINTFLLTWESYFDKKREGLEEIKAAVEALAMLNQYKPYSHYDQTRAVKAIVNESIDMGYRTGIQRMLPTNLRADLVEDLEDEGFTPVSNKRKAKSKSPSPSLSPKKSFKKVKKGPSPTGLVSAAKALHKPNNDALNLFLTTWESYFDSKGGGLEHRKAAVEALTIINRYKPYSQFDQTRVVRAIVNESNDADYKGGIQRMLPANLRADLLKDLVEQGISNKAEARSPKKSTKKATTKPVAFWQLV